MRSVAIFCCQLRPSGCFSNSGVELNFANLFNSDHRSWTQSSITLLGII
eukprot:UN02394